MPDLCCGCHRTVRDGYFERGCPFSKEPHFASAVRRTTEGATPALTRPRRVPAAIWRFRHLLHPHHYCQGCLQLARSAGTRDPTTGAPPAGESGLSSREHRSRVHCTSLRSERTGLCLMVTAGGGLFGRQMLAHWPRPSWKGGLSAFCLAHHRPTSRRQRSNQRQAHTVGHSRSSAPVG